jgi:hypothetical protein
MKANQENARAHYFQQKYPGMSADDIATTLISVTCRYAAVAGGIAGVAITANQLTTLASAGITATLWLGSLGIEMVYLSYLQIRLINDLASIYDLQLNADDPEDMLMIFGYALGVTPTEFLGKGIQIAAGATTRHAIKTYISKGTLKTVQEFARRLGFKILQRTIIKYAVPAISAAVGSGYNYVSTRSIGNIAKLHFKNQGKASEELRSLVTRQTTYKIIFPAAILYMAQVDGEYTQAERDLYKSILVRMSFDKHSSQEFQKLIEVEDNLLAAIRDLNDEAASRTLFELLSLMAAYDGKLADEELLFLQNVAHILNIPINLDELEAQVAIYRIDVTDTVWNKVINTTSSSLDVVKTKVDKLRMRWRGQSLDTTDDTP